jgi:O-antigen/teichoic acid export membrane protein
VTVSERAYSAVRWTSVSNGVRSVLQIVQVAVLARLLAPTDYGLMAMVSVVLSYATIFSDMGLSTAFVQRQLVSPEERSSLYWMSVALGGVLMLAVMALSPVAAMFFGEPSLTPILSLIATNFPIVALGQQLRMEAEKSLHFRPLAVIEIASASIGFVAGVGTASLGWGVYSMVAASLSATWLTLLLSWSMLARGWRPEFRLRWEEIRWFVQFGGGMAISGIINNLISTVDLALGGRLLGASQLGVYSVPRNLSLQVQFMINPILTRVGFPLIASVQHDKEKVKQVFLGTMNMSASVNAPIYVALAVFAPEIIFLMLGSKWSQSAPLLRVLALWGLVRSFGNPSGALLFGLGRVRLAVKWTGTALVLIAPTVWIGSNWGSLGMAWALFALQMALFIPGWAILVQPNCSATFLEYAKTVVLPTGCAVLSGTMSRLFTTTLQDEILRLATGLCVGLLFYIMTSAVFNRPWLLAIARLVKSA